MNEHITRVSLDDLPPGETDWARLAALTDEENEANIASDFDSWPLDDQARGCFFHAYPLASGRWTWDLVDPEGAILARAGVDFANWDDADAAVERLKTMLAAA